MQIGVKDLVGIRKEVEDILGDQFVTELLKSNLAGFIAEPGRKRENREQFAESARLHLIAHPLAAWLQEFERTIKKSESLGVLRVSEISARFLNFAADLIDGRRIENFRLIVPRLRQRSEFRSTAFELHVACQYLALGYSVSFIEPKRDEMTPDLLVAKSGYTMQVECKSTDDETLHQHNLFMQLAARLDKVMEKLGANLFIKIFPKVPLRGNGAERLLTEICAELSKPEKTSFLAGAVSVEWINVDTKRVLARTDPDAAGLATDAFYKLHVDRLDSGYVSMNGMQDPDGKVSWTQERGSEIRNYFEVDIFHSLRKKIRIANQQLTGDIPAVVHIEVPCKTPTSFLEIVDQNYEQIQWLVKSYRKIRAVVLECSTVNLHIEDGGNPVSQLSYIVSHPQADKAIPWELQIAGTKDFGIHLDFVEGTAIIEIIKPENLEALFAKPLLMQSAPHGDEQIIIWVKDESTIRCEVISAIAGRRIAEHHIDWESLPHEFQITASWGKDPFFLYAGAVRPLDIGPPAFSYTRTSDMGSE